MLGDLESADGVAKATRQLLEQADAYGRLPTPVDDIVSAAQLVEPEESALSDFALGRAPKHIRAAMTLVKSKVCAVLDRKAREVHLNPGIDQPERKAFKRLHEVSHDILPWQQELAYADDDLTLAPTTKILFEREANQGAAELLFQRELFSQMAADYGIGTAAIVELAELFGASRHAAFRRYVETHRGSLAGLVLKPNPCSLDPLSYRRKETFHSAAWNCRLGSPRCWPAILREEPYSFVSHCQGALFCDAPQQIDINWPDVDNVLVPLKVEIFSNSYSIFVLMWQPLRERFKHRRFIAGSRAGALR